MKKQAIHTERTIRAGWPELLPLTALSICLLFGLYTLSAHLQHGPIFCGMGLLCGILLYLLFYRGGPHVPANALPFLAASGIGYLCALTLSQIEELGGAACLLAGLGLPAALLPLLTLSAIGVERIGTKGLFAMAGSALGSAAVMLYVLRVWREEALLLTVVGFLALLLLLGVFSLMPALSGTTTVYLVENREDGQPKPLVLPNTTPRTSPVVEPEDREEEFAPFQPPNLLDLLAVGTGNPHRGDQEDGWAKEGHGETVPQPESTTFEALLDGFAHRRQEQSQVQTREESAFTADSPGEFGETEDALPNSGSRFAVLLREARQHLEMVQPEQDRELEPETDPESDPNPEPETQPEPTPGPESNPESNPFSETLSEKERQLARLILQGYTESAIASAMGITVNTQKSYRKNLYTKLEIHAKRELFELAARHRFTGT